MRGNTSFRAFVLFSQHTNISTGIVNISHFPGTHYVYCVHVNAVRYRDGRVIASVHIAGCTVIAVRS